MAYDGLTHFSLAVAATRSHTSATPSVNLILPEFNAASIFAGIRTAIEFGLEVADRTTARLNVISLGSTASGRDLQGLLSFLEKDFALLERIAFAVIPASELAGRAFHPDDAWIPTHWRTAHPLDVAVRSGRIDPSKVIYLVQDYEPGFSPWSSEYALARSTYHAGFRIVVNSSPLQQYLETVEGLLIRDEHVFRPRLDLRRAEQAASRRSAPPGAARVLFYARPKKPRNLFTIGMSAMQIAAGDMKNQGLNLEFHSAGDTHPLPRVGPLSTMTVHGRLGWKEYFEQLSRSDVVFSLQHSPHPSHPPLDAVASGALAVTNEMHGTREHLHPSLIAVEPEPALLAAALVEAATKLLQGRHAGGFSPEIAQTLGRDLAEVASAVSVTL